MQHFTKDIGFQRHVRACNNAMLPGVRRPFLIGSQSSDGAPAPDDRALQPRQQGSEWADPKPSDTDEQVVGWLAPRLASALRQMSAAGMTAVKCSANRVVLNDPAALPRIVRELAELGWYRWRGEAFDVRAKPDGPVLTQIDRGAIPLFGVQAAGVHVNGLVHQPDGLHLWVARRAIHKFLDPGKLDHIVAGGVPAGLGPAETLIKEAGEEAAIPPEVAASAVPVGVIEYAMERPEGLRRDCLYCYDLMLPNSFIPEASDGEVAAFELWPMARVVETVLGTDEFKFNVNLVLIDLFIRLGLVAETEAGSLRAGLGGAIEA